MRWSISLRAEGDRLVEREEIVELADAVAPHEGIASGIGTSSYAAQIVVEAPDSDEAVARATEVFQVAATRAGLPSWPAVCTNAVSEDAEREDFG